VGRLRYEAGQTVVLFALLLPLLLGLGAIAVDVGYWYVVKKTAQDAADAAALAAARELSDCAAAQEVGQVYAESNMPDATAEVSCGTPGIAAGNVEVTAEADTFFGGIFGVLDVTITQRAVAERLSNPGNLAIFAHDDECGSEFPLEFDGQDVFVSGFVHTNGRFRISRGPFWAADGTFNESSCRPSIEADVLSQFGESRPPPWGTACAGGPCREPLEGSFRDWPAWFTPADFGWSSRCTYKGATIEITARQVVITGPDQVIAHDGTLPRGTYCATESFAVTGDGVRGEITALAPSITVDASNTELRPYSGTRVLFFAVPNGDFNTENDGSLAGGGNPSCQPDPAADMTLNGEGHSWRRAVIFSPCGRVVVNMTVDELVGTIIAHQVKVAADGFEMTGWDDFEVPTALVE